jgi:hypothetical protein
MYAYQACPAQVTDDKRSVLLIAPETYKVDKDLGMTEGTTT